MSIKIEYKTLTLLDRDLLEKYFRSNCLFSVNDFTTIYEWNIEDKAEYAVVDNALILRTELSGRVTYYSPLGQGDTIDIRQLIEKIRADDSRPHSIAQIRVTDVDKLKGIVGYMPITYDRDYCDYIYLAADLISLSGKKLHAKRNHLNKFSSTYQHAFRDYEEADFEACLTLYDNWAKVSMPSNDSERRALVRALNNIEALKIQCGVIEIDGRVEAFGVVSRSICNVGQVHFEKANTAFDGIFAAINNYCAKAYLSSCEYVNRQDDMGLEGLRRAKLSYHPVMLLDKYLLVSDNTAE